MPGFRKRTYGSAFGSRYRGAKRRRTTGLRRRRFASRYRRKTVGFTGQDGRTAAFGYRTRKTRPARFRRMLWNATAMKAHYRSIGSDATPMTTPLNTTQCNVYAIRADAVGIDPTVFPFWMVTGGAQAIDEGVTVPNFQDDIIIRGGKLVLNISNNDLVEADSPDDIYLRVFLVKTQEGAPEVPSSLPGPDTFSREWDPTVLSDFQRRIGKPLLSRTMCLKGGTSVSFQHRLKPMKIDQGKYLEQDGVFYWFVMVANQGFAVNSNIMSTKSYSLSFSGDAVPAT